jgi:hypothetical protein
MKIGKIKLATKKEIATYTIIALIILLSIPRIVYFLVVSIVPNIKLLQKSENEKRSDQYGTMYTFFEEVKNIPNGEFTLISQDNKNYFFGRYWLYPKLLFIDSPNLKYANYALVVLPVDILKLESMEKLGFKVVRKVYSKNGDLYGLILKK